MALGKLEQLESQSIYIVREAYQQHCRVALLWSMGKDSTALLWICRKAFFGKLPFPVVHIDTSYKFPEMYRFRDELAAQWGLELIVARNDAALAAGMGPARSGPGASNCKERGAERGASSSFEASACCTALKTEALKQLIAREGFSALLLGIRGDEHGVRAKERYFSPRDEDFLWDYAHQPAELWDLYRSGHAKAVPGRGACPAGGHVRVHPMLHWSELDVWRYVQREGIPATQLYFARDGRRYRSIGCQPCCQPVPSAAASVEEILEELSTTDRAEREGRSQDKESVYTMQKLRALGYM